MKGANKRVTRMTPTCRDRDRDRDRERLPKERERERERESNLEPYYEQHQQHTFIHFLSSTLAFFPFHSVTCQTEESDDHLRGE